MEKDAQNLICDGALEIINITEEYYEEAVEIYSKYFMKNENVCIATDVLENPMAISEMIVLIREILKDGLSFGAKDCATNQLVAICINKIIKPSSGCSLDAIFETFQSPQMVVIGEYLNRMENTFNLFKMWNIDCSMEIVFLSTRPEYERKGIARSLSLHSIEFARMMGKGMLARTENLPANIKDMRPKAVCSVFTSKFSQRIGEKLKFETVNLVPNSEFSFKGKTFAEKIDPIHVVSTFAAMRLDV